MTYFRDAKKQNWVLLKKFEGGKKKKKGFRVELRAKSNFESNARGKLRQTIYFFFGLSFKEYFSGSRLRIESWLSLTFCYVSLLI